MSRKGDRKSTTQREEGAGNLREVVLGVAMSRTGISRVKARPTGELA
jgi:hypothetical protein